MKVIKIYYVLNLWCLCGAFSGRRDITPTFQEAVGHQSLQSILTSIEQRLRNLDSIYSMQLSPTLQGKLEQYQRKLESIDVKIIRLESLMMLNLDKISENISARNFKEDIAKTNLAKKIDSVYEGLSHRLTYLDRKFDAHFAKTQGKLDSAMTHLEEIWDGISRRDESLEVELSDTITAIDDLKSSYVNLESNIATNYEQSLRNQKSMLESHVSLNLIVKNLLENSTKNFNLIQNHFNYTISSLNETKSTVDSFQTDLRGDLNEYAVKVAEMSVENWKSRKTVLETYESIGNGLNDTKTEVQNGFRALMVLVAKISNKDRVLSDSSQMDRLNNKLDSNFEKVFSSQSLFMDSCYRLQMDESQIESKISDILEKLMETFEQKTAVEIKDIRNLEKAIKNHDSHIIKALHQIGSNVITLYEKINKDNAQVQNELTKVKENANGLFLLLQNKLASEEIPSPLNLELLEKIEILSNRSTNLITSLQDSQNSSKIEEFFSNISQSINRIQEKLNVCDNLREDNITINRPESSGEFEAAITQIFGRNPLSNKTMTTTSASKRVNDTINDDELNSLIDQVYGQSSANFVQETVENATGSRCKHDLRDLIDVRSGLGDESGTTECPPLDLDGNDMEITTNRVVDDDAQGRDEIIVQEQTILDQEVYDDINNETQINQNNLTSANID